MIRLTAIIPHSKVWILKKSDLVSLIQYNGGSCLGHNIYQNSEAAFGSFQKNCHAWWIIHGLGEKKSAHQVLQMMQVLLRELWAV